MVNKNNNNDDDHIVKNDGFTFIIDGMVIVYKHAYIMN